MLRNDDRIKFNFISRYYTYVYTDSIDFFFSLSLSLIVKIIRIILSK